MYTNIKREDLEGAILGDHELYTSMSLIADKLRVIYTALGWTHMTMEFSKADDTVDMLTQHVLEALNTVEEGKEEPTEEVSCSTAGLEVHGWWDEDTLVLDYRFVL